MVLLGDMHVGSRVGLCDPNTVTLNDSGQPTREALWTIWDRESNSDWHSPDLLIVNGDIIDGPNRKEQGYGQLTTDANEQVDWAVDLLKMWDAKRIHIVRGSGYHVDKGGLPCEELVARRVGAALWPNTNDTYSGHHIYVTVEGTTFHIQHKISVGRIWHTRTTPLAREMLYSVLNDSLRDVVAEYRTNVTIRSHAHYFCHVEYADYEGFILPCWQAISPWMEANMPISISPDIGYLGIEVDDTVMFTEKRLWRLEDVQKPPHIVYGASNE